MAANFDTIEMCQKDILSKFIQNKIKNVYINYNSHPFTKKWTADD